jgi:hypothetical protein
MNLTSSQSFLALFQLSVTIASAMVACLGALFYLRRVRLERPAIGRFNGRDVAFLFAFLVLLPGLYLLLPQWALTSVLVLTFAVALSIGFRPVLGPTPLWLSIGVLIGANLWMGQHMINNVTNWHFVWAENSLVVLLAAISVANLYVQGGMQLRHVAWFAGGLAIYDSIFTLVWPVSNLLIREFVNHPLFPAMGMRIGFDEAIVGLGDLLVYAGFTIAAVKAYGRPGLRLALTLVLVFGAVLPTLSGLLLNYVDSRLDVVIPAQTWFGPAAVVGYLWLRRRYGRERTMKEYLTTIDLGRSEPPPATVVVPEEPNIEAQPISA